jgi:cyanophycinase
MGRRSCTIWHWLGARLGATLAACVAVTVSSPAVSPAQEPAATIIRERSECRGSLVIAGGGLLPEAIFDRFLELGGGLKTRLVVVTSASTLADYPEIETRVMSFWYEQPVQSVTMLHAKTRDDADRPEFSSALDDATAVWFIGGNQLRVTRIYQGTKTEERLHALVRRGGVIGGTSAGAAIMSRVMIGGNTPNGPIIETGFGFLPGTIIDQHFLRRNRQNRLLHALQSQPGLVGIGVDEGTALVVMPARVEVIGDSDVVMCLAKTGQRTEIVQRFKPGAVIQLDQWSLGAAGRARWDQYGKSDKRPSPELAQGAVVISGSKPPKAAVEEFLAAAGGKDAPVVVVTECDDDHDVQTHLQGCLEAAGAENVKMCRALTPNELTKPDVQAALSQARGVWFVGAQERRMLDLVAQPRMDKLVKDVLSRGGVVGGSCAGAKIHGDGLLVPASDDADPLDDIYTCGLGVLPGVVIEQQPADADAASSIAKVMHERFPRCVGLGLQDSAAVVVRGHTMEVVGSDPVAVFGEPNADADSVASIEMVPAGQKYNLRERRRMSDTDETAETR